MRKYIYPFIMVISLFALSNGRSALAQTGQSLRVIEVNTSTYPEITAVVDVANFGGAPVLDMTRQQFEIAEDDQSLPIINVEAINNTEQPISIALVLDLSGSAPLADVQTAANQFLDYLGPADQVSLIGFNSPVQINDLNPFKETDFTTNKELVRNTIEGLTIQPESAVYEAILKAILNTAAETATRRAVIVMTDGFDNASRSQIAGANDPRDTARDKQIPIFTVGIFSNDSTLGRDPDYLQLLARKSGGRYQEANASSELGALFQSVVDQLRLQYRLTFRTDRPADGQRHRLTFSIANNEDQATTEQEVRYPVTPNTSPKIKGVQVEIDGVLRDLSETLSGVVQVTPELSSDTGLTQVEYQIDGATVQVIDLAVDETGVWEWDTSTFEPGTYQLSIVVSDELGNTSSVTLDNLRIGSDESTTATSAETEREDTVATTAATTAQMPINLGIIIGSIIVVLAVVLFVLIIWAVWGRRKSSTATSASYSSYSGPATSSGGNEAQLERAGVAVKASEEPGADDTVADHGRSMQTVGNEATTILKRAKPGPVLALLIDQDDGDKTYSLRQKTTTIGRTNDNYVVLDDPNVSGRHVRIDMVDDTFQLHDLGATNPPKVNGLVVESHALQNDDVIEIGRTKLIFKRMAN